MYVYSYSINTVHEPQKDQRLLYKDLNLRHETNHIFIKFNK